MRKTLEILVLVGALALSSCDKADDGPKCRGGRVYDPHTDACITVQEGDEHISDVVEENYESCTIPTCFRDNFENSQYTEENWQKISLEADASYKVESGTLTLNDQMFYLDLGREITDQIYLNFLFKSNSADTEAYIGLTDNLTEELHGIHVQNEEMEYLIFGKLSGYNHQGWNEVHFEISATEDQISFGQHQLQN